MLKLRQAIVTVILCIACFGLAGAIVGYGVGEAAPSFVRWLMGREFERSPDLDPSEFGLGFGLLSGLGFGSFLGLFLVFLLTLRDAWAVIWTRLPPEDSRATTPSKPPRESGLE